MSNLESLQAVARLALLADDIEDGVDQLSSLGVVTLRPVVTGARLSEDEVIRAEDLTERASADGIHRAGLQIHQDRAGNITSTSRLVVVNVDALQLQIRIAVVSSSGVHSMLIADHFPELSADLNRENRRTEEKREKEVRMEEGQMAVSAAAAGWGCAAVV